MNKTKLIVPSSVAAHTVWTCCLKGSLDKFSNETNLCQLGDVLGFELLGELILRKAERQKVGIFSGLDGSEPGVAS